ncbi:MAG: alpha/beta hydrolase [Gemmatimonadota bacterium]
MVLPLMVLVDRKWTHRPAYQSEWLPAGNVHLRALRVGQGDTTLVLIHGYGESLLAFRGIIGPLARHFRVNAIDLPGSGLSERPASFALDSIVDDLSDFLDRSTDGPVVLVGHSMGGEIAAALALKRPDRIVRLVLIAPAGFGLGFGLADEAFSERQRELAAWSLKVRGLILQTDDPTWITDPPGLPSGVRAGNAAREAAAAVLRDFDFTALKDRYRLIQQPTLLLWGGLDPLIPVSIGRQIAEAIPNCRLVVIGNSWHRPHVEQPERVIHEIENFLSTKAME